MTASDSAASRVSGRLLSRAASINPLESHQLGRNFCSAMDSLDSTVSNHSDVPPTTATEPISDHPSHAAPAQTNATRIASACTLSRPSHATADMQQMPPSVAGITTNDTMNGSSSR